MTVRLSKEEARRIALRAQLLDAPVSPAAAGPTPLVDLVRHLTLIQLDFTATVAPSADLVAWSRLGRSYSRDDLAAALAERSLIVLRGMIRPAEDIALYLAEMRARPGGDDASDWMRGVAGWVAANATCRLDILARLSGEGPLLAQEIPDSCVVPWKSSGWTDNRNVMKMLECLEARGEVAVAGHEGRTRLWDLASRVYPDVEPVPLAEAELIKARRRLRALGVARQRAVQAMVEPGDVGDVGERAVVEGVRGTWRVDARLLDDRAEPVAGRTALLSPLDRAVFDRKRLLEIFDYDYQLEMYKPAVRRRWGYFALPILHGEQFVGKVDATSDREAGVLRVAAVYPDVRLTDTMRRAIDHEIDELAAWLGLELATPT
jgi:uncharacterized protein YcaQ